MMDPKAPCGGARGGRPVSSDEGADDGDPGLVVKCADAPVLNWIGGRVEIADVDVGAGAALGWELW